MGFLSNHGVRPDAPLDDASMVHHARALAVGLTPDGFSRFTLKGCSIAELKRIGAEAQQAAACGSHQSAAMEWLTDNIRLVEATCAAMRNEARGSLPSVSDVPRVQILMRELVVHGDALVTLERLLQSAHAFDEVQGLSMEEIWRMPSALRIELCAAFANVSRRVLKAQRERNSAEAWVQSGADTTFLRKNPRDSAFYERALQMMHDQEMPKARYALEEYLEERSVGAEAVIRMEHELQSINRLWLSNIMGTLRMLDSLDWSEHFAELSRAEQELMRDPSGIYPLMDDASRAVIRDQVCVLAKRNGASETTVARYAVRAADEGRGSAQGGVCYWLYDDDGRGALLADMDTANARIPQIAPDPRGGGYIATVLLVTALVWGLFTAAAKNALLSIVALPAAWAVASLLVNAVITRCVHPKKLLKLEIKRVPESMRTIVTIPALLSSKQRALELLDQLEAFGCVEGDENIDYLLLGDFSDSKTEHEPSDEEILLAARARIEQMNKRAGRDQYFYLHRRRSYSEASGSWMGHERKRGALMALNALLLTGESQFDAEGNAAHALQKRYAYVVTLDADTRMHPGTVQKLIGAISHPLNVRRMENGVMKGYSVLQPRMELSLASTSNAFVRLFGGHGGVDSYPTSVSDVYQDLTGTGIFGGKGIYDIKSFNAAVEGSIPDNAVVSHDLLEGSLAGAGFVADITFYDGFPKTLGSYLKRLERWTRGDWQLLPFMGRRLPISPISRYMMIANLLRSLAQPATLSLIILSMWLANPAAMLLALLCAFIPALLTLPRADGEAWLRALAQLCLLPGMSWTLLGGAGRALSRLRSKRNMLQWVTAADAEREKTDNLQIPSRICALLLLPTLVHTEWIIAALGFGVLFLVGVSWITAMQAPDERETLSDEQFHQLNELARSTWLFFDRHVPKDGSGLPPDNVQLDPPVGAAKRTSPTNIGLYLVSCLCAFELHLIDRETFIERVERTLSTLESMQKWQGHLYNWYDIDTMEPLKPRYVSSVDSGNLAACLLLLSSALEGDKEIAKRLSSLARGMDFLALYNTHRKLFAIGADIENERLSASHYDLLASESRILSYVTMMMGIVPAEHWAHLNRGVVRAGNGAALLSWSGTMFEYLMPELLMRAPEGSLIGRTNRAVVEAQRMHAGENHSLSRRAEKYPWGVSESGYNAFDMQMNYQYRAFGLNELSLRDGPDSQVIAPYASVLALAVDPNAAFENLKRMEALGWMSEMGLYEAVDFAPGRCAEGAPYQVVYSHMAHHQGMILAALTNCLCEDALVKHFMRMPEARALSLLLEENPATLVKLARRAAPRSGQRVVNPHLRKTLRSARPDALLPDAHLLYGGGGTYFTTAGGASYLRVRGVMANRWRADPALMPDGLFTHVRMQKPDRSFTASGQRVTPNWLSQRAAFDAGEVSWVSRVEELEAKLTSFVSPEDGALIQRLRLVNHTDTMIELDVTNCFTVALASQADMEAHPAFQNLFVESEWIDECALMFTRRSRDEEQHPALLHMISGVESDDLSFESDLANLTGRTGSMHVADGIAQKLSNATGATINPCSALRAHVTVPAGGTMEMTFTIAIVEHERVEETLRRYAAPDSSRRAHQLAITQAQAMLDFLGLSGQMVQLLQRASAFLMYPRLPNEARGTAAIECQMSVSGLWAIGVSGDLPIISVFIASKQQLEVVREAVRAHEFYRAMGVWCDLLLINEYGNDYEQPIRDALREIVAASHLHDLVDESGGAYIIEGASLTPAQRTLINALSAILVHCEGGTLLSQLRRQLKGGESYQGSGLLPMEPGAFALADIPRMGFNGYGGFSEDGCEYLIDLTAKRQPPAAWSNLLVNDGFGSLVTERGGGFTWDGNSRNSRVTPFDNNPLCEGWGELIYLCDSSTGRFAPLMPGPEPPMAPFRVSHGPGETRFESGNAHARWTVTQFVDAVWPIKCLRVEIEGMGQEARFYQFTAFVDWLMGVDHDDARMTRVYAEDGMCLARGTMDGVCFAHIVGGAATIRTARAKFLGADGVGSPCGLSLESFESGLAGDGCGVLTLPVELQRGKKTVIDLLIGWGHSASDCRHLRDSFVREGGEARLALTRNTWSTRLSHIALCTPNPLANALVSRWLPYQAFAGRVMGRAGLYQAGGAYGFRDQLQDMLCLIDIEPKRVRQHLLLCAAHQFEDGDVQHWWHPERMGVRTRISDDLLFLPYVTACYVRETGDTSVLFENAPFLANVEIEPGREDWYGSPPVSSETASLHDHCMRAFRRASRFGPHALPLMGSGDWNDGMNRIGPMGTGESVWLAEFLAVTAREYAEICTDEVEREALLGLDLQMRQAIEQNAWDGKWYRRAYMDDGTPVGSAESPSGVCKIDAIAQSWAVIAGLERERTESAMDEVWAQLVDEEHQLIKLLTPPFNGGALNPGYIRGYPPGIRENGGQYTHGACWVVMAYALLGQAERAWKAFEMLLPANHALTQEQAEVYKVEPYVIAADIYGEPPHEGRGGWTWYTGAAAWVTRVALKYLMGYRRRGDKATLRAILPEAWNEASVKVRIGLSEYTLTARRGTMQPTLDGVALDTEEIELKDDGKPHEAVFPVKR